jgi:hypothetical protein
MADNRLISAFSRFLPDMKATFSIFDQPQIYLSWARRGSLVDLGLRGESESRSWTELISSDGTPTRDGRCYGPIIKELFTRVELQNKRDFQRG